MERPISYTRYAQRTFLLLTGLGNIDAPNARRLISLTMNRLDHWSNPFPEALLCFRHCLAINSGSRPEGNLTKIPPEPLRRQVMGQGSEPELSVTSSFRCYSFKSRFHGWQVCLLFSHCMEPMLPKNDSTSAGRFPTWPALPSAKYYQPV